MSTARSQQKRKVYRIAIAHPSASATDLTKESRGSIATRVILKSLCRLGYIEGQNLLIERYSGEGRAPSYPELARDVVRRNPDLIIALAGGLQLDFKAATTTIPILAIDASFVEKGIVPSLARPGGNITGVSVNIGDDEWETRIQLLKEMVPQAARLAWVETREIRDRDNAVELEQGRKVGLTRVGPPLNHTIDETEYRRLFATLAQEGAEMIAVTEDAENVTNLRLIIELAEKRRLPAMYPYREFVEAGGLMSYGVDLREIGGRAADMADRIVKG
jgi:putative ABC transport system substrate-binding protein